VKAFMLKIWPRLPRWAVVVVVFLVAAEAVSRLDDWMFFGISFLANPDRARDLTVRDEKGIHGRPNGQFRKWQLNAFGFRGPEISERPAPDTLRILILGASETFGLHESENKEYPAQLAEKLRLINPHIEVINAAMAGISVKSMLPYWEKWGSRFQPRLVLIYPSPIFYLDDEPPKPPRLDAPTEGPGLTSQSRFAGRVWETLRRTEWVRWVRLEFILWREKQRQGPEWVFRSVPQERLDLFRDDLAALVGAIRARGAEPILVTHAIRSASPPRPEDLAGLKAMSVFAPRATTDTIVAFEEAANRAMRDLGRRDKIPVYDAASVLNGHRDDLADLVHFNDKGAEVLAGFLAKQLQPILAAMLGKD